MEWNSKRVLGILLLFLVLNTLILFAFSRRRTESPAIYNESYEVGWSPELSAQDVIEQHADDMNHFSLFAENTFTPRQKGILVRKGFPLATFKEIRVTPESTFDDLVNYYMSYMTTKYFHCPGRRRLGDANDGGKDVCLSADYKLESKNCLVYSLGLSHELEFDKEISREPYWCRDYGFDHTVNNSHENTEYFKTYMIGVTGRNRQPKLKTIKEILESNSHLKVDIDILKMDIEYSEWDTLPVALEDGAFNRVKQFMIEWHTYADHQLNRHNVLSALRLFKALEKKGFYAFSTIVNPDAGLYVHGGVPCCYEIAYINVNYLWAGG